MDNRPIGVFDSGVGGLTVLREVIEELPEEDIVYLGDTARTPYGTRSKEVIIEYSIETIKFLLTKDVKAVIIACNTVSALAMQEVQMEFNIPIIGVIEPGIRAAVGVTRNSRIGLIATEGTIRSQVYQRGLKELLPNSEVIDVSCPSFVSIVEGGLENTNEAEEIIRKHLSELKEQQIDSLILGCTHFPVLRPVIGRVLGNGVLMIDPAHETAKMAHKILEESDIISDRADCGRYNFYVSGDPVKFRRIGSNILGRDIESIEKVKISDI